MKLKYILVGLVITLVSCARQEQFNIEKETKEILRLHNLQRDYHFKKDSVAFANQLSENFIAVNRGIISQPKREETISKYHAYFSSVEFLKWDDLSDPIIRFSDDGTLAYTIVDKIVKVAYTNQDHQEGGTHFVWTAIYKKYKDGWKMDCITSTNKPIE